MPSEDDLKKEIRMRLGKLYADRITAGMKEVEAKRLWVEETQEAFIAFEKEYEHRHLAARRERIIRGATKSDAPCGASTCWEATKEVCRCSCVGYNHGIAHDPERQEEYRKLKPNSEAL